MSKIVVTAGTAGSATETTMIGNLIAGVTAPLKVVSKEDIAGAVTYHSDKSVAQQCLGAMVAGFAIGNAAGHKVPFASSWRGH